MTEITRSLPGPGGERRRTLQRFGGHVELRVTPPDGHRGHAEQRLDRAELLLAEFDERLSRFDAGSELCALNDDPRDAVPASPMMLRFAEAVGWAGRRSGGLVDATLLRELEAAGYDRHLPLDELDAHRPLQRTTGPQPAAPRSGAWRAVAARGGAVHRPVGVRLDSGGLGKGLAADLAADALRGATSWMVNCGGDLRLGGTARLPRAIDITDPLDPSNTLHRLHVISGGVATSGTTRRSWTTEHDTPAHHVIDPRTGRPAETDLLQVTALAPTALEAEVLAKTALLTGGAAAHRVLTHGGVVVHRSGVIEVLPPPSLHQHRRRPRPRMQVLAPTAPRDLARR